jgi:hypothetical protein
MIEIPISPGELIDRITILEIKREQLRCPEKRDNVIKELRLLKNVRDFEVQPSPEISTLTAQLKAINQALWNIEDAIRACEQQANFGEDFVDLARSVYRRNDERSRIKRDINDILGSEVIEEKSYSEY